ncbi:MAG: hypothetical protein KC933_22610 [Myxococcales bacterium]|nr:hypothetical protein [Myxococcales bacterium]MCB9646064.1 hypothetical protein [Deltaproteobacteria bacterium]
MATLWVGVGAACTEAPPGGSPDTGVVADVGADGGVDAEIDTGVMPTDAEVDAGIADAAEDGGAEVDGGPLDAGADAGTDGGLTCWSCHGANGNPAPPTDLQGRSDPALPTVGAHASHMAPRVFYRSGECADCHLVPAAVDDPGHVDPAPADLTWGPVPGAGGVAPSYVNGTCEVYCHGVSLNGGTNVNPSWTAAGQQTVVCGSCHGVPPPPPHPELQTLECGGCHPFSGLFPIDAARHVDGVLDVTLGCTACHGSGSDPAPPLDTQGRSATTFLTVGAHQAHLAPSPLSRDPVCSDCHLVPTAVGDPGHLGPAPAELEWGAVAQADNAVPSYDGTDGGCDVYCHGSTLSGGSNPRPIWNQVGAGQAACGACHGLPPPAPHPAVSGASCGPCHPFNGFIPDQPERHIDGILDVAVQCNTCHGSAANDAPPADTQGRTATTFRTVGAHQTHLSPGAHRTGRCADCHVVPTDVADPGHIDVAPAELTWGAVPQADGVNPAYAGNGTCTVYCHGASLSGGTNTTPTWNVVGAGEAACGACHGVPPPLPHPQVAASDCGPCHPFSGVTPDDPLRHVDGILDVAQGCTSCHGTGNDPAPPLDLSGGSATTSRGVGAHQSHLNAGPLADAVACAECHVVPLQVTSPGHLDGDGMAELNFGGLATHDGANASYNGATCTAYCHGATLAGGTNTQPTWTSVGTGEAACGACHGLPPPAPHPANPQCDTCHGAVVNAQLQIIDTSLHINGTVEALAQCGSCHGLPPATGAHLTHAGLAVAQYGALGTAADLTSPTGYAFGCGHCHPRDSSQHLNGGLAQVVLYDPSAPAGSLKALNPPTASYVPGPVTNTDAFGLSYTEGTCSDVYCHSRVDTTSSAPAVPGVDFPFTGYPIAYQPPPSVTRARGYTAVGWGQSLVCGDCHGFPARGAHPTVRDATGESHAFLRGDGQEVLHMFNHGFAPVPCRACHASTVEVSGAYTRTALGVTTVQAVPIGSFAAHVNGDVEVVFDGQNVIPYGPVSVSLAGAAWDPATRTCTNVGCHKLQTAVPFGNPYRTQVTPECNQCHRM